MNPSDSRTFDNLALLYQGVLTPPVRVRSGTQMIADYPSFSRQTRELLAAVERQAIQSGYAESDVRNTNYAIVAYLDESILDSDDPKRHQWTSLQADMYGEAVAGESFFHNLDALLKRRDSPQLTDILEVYYLCLLLGYRGRYAGYAREQATELKRYEDDLRARIEQARGRNIVLWPGEGPGLPDKPSGPTSEDRLHRRLRVWALVAVAAIPIIWALCRVALYSQASGVQASLVP